MTTTTRYRTSCVRADERFFSDNRTRFRSSLWIGRADEDEDGRSARIRFCSKELTMFEYTKTQAVEKDGARYPSSQAELKSIALKK
jgi:hypothetical protein